MVSTWKKKRKIAARNRSGERDGVCEAETKMAGIEADEQKVTVMSKKV